MGGPGLLFPVTVRRWGRGREPNVGTSEEVSGAAWEYASPDSGILHRRVGVTKLSAVVSTQLRRTIPVGTDPSVSKVFGWTGHSLDCLRFHCI